MFSPAFLEEIVLPFFTTKTRGSGFGLPIAKHLIEAHRGRIKIACPLKQGTVVTLQPPVERWTEQPHDQENHSGGVQPVPAVAAD